jgi:hypothetical protein
LIEYFPRIQEHRPSSDNGKVSLDFVSLHHGVLWRDVLQQQPKLGDIPLAIAQPIYRTTLNVLTIHPECLMESAVCSDNAQVLIENQEWIADRIYDRLRERVRFIEVYERLFVRPRQRGSWSGARSIVRRFHISTLQESSPLQRALKTSSRPPIGDQRLAQISRQPLCHPPPPCLHRQADKFPPAQETRDPLARTARPKANIRYYKEDGNHLSRDYNPMPR